MRVTHLTFNLRAGHQRRHRVEHHYVNRPCADEGVHNLQRLFAGARLRHIQLVYLHPNRAGVLGVQGVFGIDESANTTALLRLGDDLQSKGGFTGRFRAVNFHNPPARHPANADGDVQRDRAGGDGFDLHPGSVAQPHHGAFAELLLYLSERLFQNLLFLCDFHERSLLYQKIVYLKDYSILRKPCKGTVEFLFRRGTRFSSFIRTSEGHGYSRMKRIGMDTTCAHPLHPCQSVCSSQRTRMRRIGTGYTTSVPPPHPQQEVISLWFRPCVVARTALQHPHPVSPATPAPEPPGRCPDGRLCLQVSRKCVRSPRTATACRPASCRGTR